MLQLIISKCSVHLSGKGMGKWLSVWWWWWGHVAAAIQIVCVRKQSARIRDWVLIFSFTPSKLPCPSLDSPRAFNQAPMAGDKCLEHEPMPV